MLPQVDPPTASLTKSKSTPGSKLLGGVGSAVGAAFNRASRRVGQRERAGTTTENPPRFFSLFKKPRQMQRWGEPQGQPHTNWFDLFFDLIFVGAAFQLGALLKADVNAEGVLYFVAIFFALFQSWQNKLQYDARIDADDLAHKVGNIIEALLVCAAALHIGSGSEGSAAVTTPVGDMQDRTSGHAWGFSLCCAVLRVMDALRWNEVKQARETPGAIAYSKVIVRQQLKTALIYSGAAVLSNSQWTPSAPHNGAAFLWILATMFEQHSLTVRMMCGAKMPTREQRLPMNIAFSLHRYGEWIMLMVGESMLSLVVGVRLSDTPSFYAVFACGFFSAAALQLLHYTTQPFEPGEHAMRRDGKAGTIWCQSLMYYSAALIAFGVAVKVLLAYHDKPYLKQKYGWLACGSLALSYLLMQWMQTLHGGMDQFVVDVGLHTSLPTWLFDTTKPHRSSADARSARQIAEEDLDNDECVRRRRRYIGLAKLLLLLALAVLPLANMRALILSVTLALWCQAVLVLEFLTRSTATASHGAVAHHEAHEEGGGGGHHHAQGDQEQEPPIVITISNESSAQLGGHGAGGGAGTDLATTGNTSTV